MIVIDGPATATVEDHLDQTVLAPDHQLSEVLSALARLVRANAITAAVARHALDEATALEMQDRIRVLDGLYVALAEERSCPLLTTDQRLAGAHPPCEIILATGD